MIKVKHWVRICKEKMNRDPDCKTYSNLVESFKRGREHVGVNRWHNFKSMCWHLFEPGVIIVIVTTVSFYLIPLWIFLSPKIGRGDVNCPLLFLASQNMERINIILRSLGTSANSSILAFISKASNVARVEVYWTAAHAHTHTHTHTPFLWS